MALELQRLALEEIEALEAAAAQRFRKNPALGQLAHIEPLDALLQTTKKRPHKETLLQQHELKYFGEQVQRDCLRAQAAFGGSVLTDEAGVLNDPSMKFGEFERQLAKLAAKHADKTHQGANANAGASVASFSALYSIYLSAPDDAVKGNKYKRRHLLSAGAAHLSELVAAAFNEVEMYGRFLDLSLYYEMYKLAVLSHDTYGEYLRGIKAFPNSRITDAYVKYLESLLQYLSRFYQNAHPLDPLPSLEQETSPLPTQQDGEPNEKGEVFCKACDKLFSKETVYKGHLDGKKHKKNVAAAASGSSQQLKGPSAKQLETQVKILLQALDSELSATIEDQERRSGLSDREKMLEALAVEGEESDFTGAESDSNDEQEDDNDDEFYSKDLPIGTDGIPIPLWLYKLQGLHRTYLCEICGNAIYKGRQQYTKHFSQAKHIHGLSCLGIPEEDVWSFSHISTLEEAQALWNKIRRSRIESQQDVDNTVEVEDDEGNVMSHKDYVELKKQGLL